MSDREFFNLTAIGFGSFLGILVINFRAWLRNRKKKMPSLSWWRRRGLRRKI